MLTQKVKELTSRLERDIPAEVQRVRQLQTQNSQVSEKNNLVTLSLSLIA